MTAARPKNDPKAIVAWSMFDWANSAFTTLVVTFIYATYFTRTFAPDEVTGTALWSRAVSLSGLIVALAAPLLGAVADRGGTRKRSLLTTTLACVLATTALTFVVPEGQNAVLTALVLFVIGNVAFEIGMVFYNAFLPDIVTSDRIGRVSGYGWGLGYVGGLSCMALGLFGFVGFGGGDGFLGLSTENAFNVRATNLLVAGWFLVFSLPLFFTMPETKATDGGVSVRAALSELGRTFREIRRYGEIVKFLLARLIYNDGLVTIFAFGGIYAAGTFGMELSDVLMFGIVINVTAGLGALAFGFVDDKIGGKATVMVSLVVLFAATGLALFAPSVAWLWVAGIGIGIFAGPNQSASRSLMGRFVPEMHRSEFFGFFAFSGKFTAFLGPLFFGYATQIFGTQRAGVGAVLVFFLVGGLVLASVDERRGIAAATEG